MILGIIISILTFPGVVVHELGHLLCCRMLRIPVHKVCYFRLGNPAGYVVHDAAPNAIQQIAVGFGPFFLNTGLGLLLGLIAALARHRYGALLSWPMIILPWLSVSIAMHAFPSTGDAGAIWRSLWSCDTSWPIRILGIPVVVVIYVGALASIFWLDLAYGVGVLWLALRLVAGFA